MPATEADLLALAEQGRGYELINRDLVEKQAGFRHGRAQFNLTGESAGQTRKAVPARRACRPSSPQAARRRGSSALELQVKEMLFGEDEDETPPAAAKG